jgi:hypothetical protein
MKSTERSVPFGARLKGLGALCVVGLILAGCASTDPGATAVLGDGTTVTASDPTRMTRSGFLSDYGRLKPAPMGDGVECWRAAEFDAKTYDKVLISRMLVTLKPGETHGIDPTDLKALTDYFHDSLVRALKPQMQVVGSPGPGVIVMGIALTDLVPTEVARSVAGTLVPYGFVAEAGSGVATGRPAGATPYLGEAGMEMQIRDGASATIVGECRDTQIGRKYAADLDAGAAGAAQTWASGYLNSFQSWAYARNAFDKWSALTANRIAELRGAEPAR